MRKAASYIEQARTPLPDRTAKYNLIYHLGIDNVFPSSFLSGIDPEAPLKLQRRVWQDVNAHALVNRMLGFDWRFTLADNDLPKVIGATRFLTQASSRVQAQGNAVTLVFQGSSPWFSTAGDHYQEKTRVRTTVRALGSQASRLVETRP